MSPMPIIHRETVLKEWIDYNGHMNEGYYPVVFSHAGDELMAMIGVTPDYIKSTQLTFFTVESHIRFLKEVKLGDSLTVRLQILGVREKKLHLWYCMSLGDDGPEVATLESMWLFYDGKAGTVGPIVSEVRRLIDEMVDAQGDLPTPDAAGRQIVL
ncbi:MAG: thioesterase family protein [Dongiaceae bacterium]